VTQDGSSAVAGVHEGDVLAGKYRVERVLGVGGMGVVVAAHHMHLDHKVALKFLLPAMLDHREAVERFAREARAAVKITNEHVARVTDVGTLDNGAPYMVMEFLEGGDLADWLRRHGPLPIEQAVDFVLQACVAVADAHGLGIVHRDLKPANLFCVRRSDGQSLIKVLDFGISKMNAMGSSSPGASVTQTSAMLGSPLYMSPEQMQSPKSVDAKTDIWAMGVVLYELLTGLTPFDGETIAEVAIKAATHAPPSIRAVRPDVPAELESAIFKCFEKDRRLRPANVAEFAISLLPFAPLRSRASVERISGIINSAGLSVSGHAIALPPHTHGGGAAATALVSVSPVGRTAGGATAGNSEPSRSKPLVAAIAGVFALLAAASFVALRARHDPTVAASPPVAVSALPPIEAAPVKAFVAVDPPPAATSVAGAAIPVAPLPSATHAHPGAPPAPRPKASSQPPPIAAPSAPPGPAPGSTSGDPLSNLRVK
jgi:serine/threonine protein kinase